MKTKKLTIRIFCAVTAALMLAFTSPVTVLAADSQASAVLDATLEKLAKDIPSPAFGTSAGEWTVLSLARGGYYEPDSAYFEEYYSRIVEAVNTQAAKVNKNGALHKVKSTENSRLIIALSAIGKDASSVGDWNLITPYEDFGWIKKQGINGPVFALIALDTNGYQTEDPTIRTQCIEFILGRQLEDGGWALSGTAADPDITAMVLQSLRPYRAQPEVAKAAERGFLALSSMQMENGGYASWGTVNSESCAQVIVACTAWGIDPDTDAAFVKNGSSAVDALLSHYVEEKNAFAHVVGQGADGMATDQAAYALVAYDRFQKNMTSLYDMSDVIDGTDPDTPTTDVPTTDTPPVDNPPTGESADIIHPCLLALMSACSAAVIIKKRAHSTHLSN